MRGEASETSEGPEPASETLVSHTLHPHPKFSGSRVRRGTLRGQFEVAQLVQWYRVGHQGQTQK